MKRLALLAALVLSACAPVAQLAQPGEGATLTRDADALLLSNPGPGPLAGDPTRPGDGPALTVSGAGLGGDPAALTWCRANPERTRLSCNLPEVPAGQRLRIRLTGDVQDAAVLAYRPTTGARPVLVWLK